MPLFNFAYTVPFPEDSKITQEQAFEAFRIKVRDPMKFVSAFSACEVIEETPTFVKRKVTPRVGEAFHEDVDLYAPSLVVFKGDNGSMVTNLISETETGKLLMTFTFSFPLPPDLVPGSKEEAEKKDTFKNMSKGAVTKSMEATLEMFAQGKLN